MLLGFLFESAGAGEWLVLLAVVLVAVGPKRLPAVARELGRWYARFRRAAESFKRELMELDAQARRAASNAEQEAKDVFVIEGNEATAKPFLEA